MEEQSSEKSRMLLQLFVKLLDGQTLSIQFPAPSVCVEAVKERILEITSIPVCLQRLIRGHQLGESSVVSDRDVTLNLSLRLPGGKGGFGSLLRGAATKAGQKKTSNFEACRDMSGRRLRHVNAEKRLEEWKAEEEDRKLEKIAEEFIKKKAKSGKKGAGDGEAAKYVEKYREESARCVAVIEEAVKEASRSGKRKALPGVLDSKRLKVWLGKRKVDGSDSEDMDDSSSEDEDGEENEKSVVTNNGNDSDSNKAAEGSSDSVTGERLGGDSCGVASSDSGSEEEKEIGNQQSSEPGEGIASHVDSIGMQPQVHEEKVANSASECYVGAAQYQSRKLESEINDKEEINSQPGCTRSSLTGGVEKRIVENQMNGSPDLNSGAQEETVVSSTNIAGPAKPLNFDEYNSPQEMENLGMERLKSELQERGLKCGGTLQERAARLFLLKSTPVEKLPKKLLAKK